MTNAYPSGGAHPPAPLPLILPPALNGYRRSLYPGRAASVYFDRHPPNEWREHAHDHDQISGTVGDGSCALTWQTPDGAWHRHLILPGTYWVIPRGMPHTLQCPAETDMVTLFMEVPFVADILNHCPPEFAIVPLGQLASRDLVIGQHSRSFLNLCRGTAPVNAIYVESIGTVLGTHVLQTLFNGSALRDLRSGLPEDSLGRLMAFLEVNFALALTLDDLAAAAGYSPGHFGVLFKRSMGLTPLDYLMRHRLGRACELLATTTRKELDIAHACGFSDDTHLARWIRKVLHCRPRQLRGLGPSGFGPIFPGHHPSPPDANWLQSGS